MKEKIKTLAWKKLSHWACLATLTSWASEGGPCPLDFEVFGKKGCFLVVSGKNKFHHFWPSPGKIPNWPHVKKYFRRP